METGKGGRPVRGAMSKVLEAQETRHVNALLVETRNEATHDVHTMDGSISVHPDGESPRDGEEAFVDKAWKGNMFFVAETECFREPNHLSARLSQDRFAKHVFGKCSTPMVGSHPLVQIQHPVHHHVHHL